ncbi:MAG: hypothetical protein ACHQRM_14060 [Bacteroidia bacterium]
MNKHTLLALLFMFSLTVLSVPSKACDKVLHNPKSPKGSHTHKH